MEGVGIGYAVGLGSPTPASMVLQTSIWSAIRAFRRWESIRCTIAWDCGPGRSAQLDVQRATLGYRPPLCAMMHTLSVVCCRSARQWNAQKGCPLQNRLQLTVALAGLLTRPVQPNALMASSARRWATSALHRVCSWRRRRARLGCCLLVRRRSHIGWKHQQPHRRVYVASFAQVALLIMFSALDMGTKFTVGSTLVVSHLCVTGALP